MDVIVLVDLMAEKLISIRDAGDLSLARLCQRFFKGVAATSPHHLQ